MSTWDKLSMADRAKYIKLAVQNGITSLGDIRDTYNRYAEGGPKSKGEFIPVSEVPTYAWNNNTMIKDTSGNKKKFADVLKVDPSYKVLVDSDTGKLITEEYLLSDDHNLSQDVLENQISNNTRGNRGLDVYQGQIKAREEFKQALNKAGVFSDLRTKNYQNALRRNPNFGNDWNMFNNIMEFTNIATGGAANRLSLTQNARLLYDIGDAILGDGSWDNVGNSILGNNGIVSDKFAAEHPYWSMVINGGLDIPGGIATYKTYNTLRNPRSSYNIRRGMSLKKGKDLDYALRDLHDYNVRKQMQGINAAELYGLDYADELVNSGLIDSYAGRPTIGGNNKYYARTSAPGNQVSTGVKDVVDNRLVNPDRPVFLSAGEPWQEFSTANTIHEFPLEAFGRRSSVDWNGVPTGIDVFDVYNGYTGPNPGYIQGVSHPMAFQISPRSAYTGFQTTVPAEDYVRGFMNVPHTTYERRMLGDIPFVQKTEYTPNGRKPYINSSGIPMKEPPTAEFHKVSKEEVLNALTDTFYKRNVIPKLKASTGSPSPTSVFRQGKNNRVSLHKGPLKDNPNAHGLHYTSNGDNLLRSDVKNIDSNAIHEVVGHGTEDLLPDKVINNYKRILQDFDSKLFKNENSNNYGELRATLKEVEHYLETQGKNIDDITDAEFLRILKNTNAYGNDYTGQLWSKINNGTPATAIYDASEIVPYPHLLGRFNIPHTMKPYANYTIDLMRRAIKYLPAVGGVGLGLSATVNNSNTYGKGGWMQSLMDGTLFTEPPSTESNEEQAQTQIQPTIPKEPIYLWEKRMQNMPVFTSLFRNMYERVDKDKMPLINIEEMPLTYIEETVNKNFDKYPKSPNSSYEEAKKWMDTYGYIDYMNSQARNIQKKRIIDASHQDPIRTGRKFIPLNDIPVNSKDAKKFDLSLLEYDPDIIDLIATNLPEGYDIYEALTLPIHETHLGRRKTNLSTNEGRIRALINNHNYELDLHYFSDIAQYVRNAAKKLGIKKGIGNLILQTHDLEAFKKNNPKLYKEMNRDAKERFNEKRWEQNNSQYKDVDVPYMMHALLQYRDGKYNRGELGYVNDTKEYTKKLKQSPGLREYLISKGYIK